MPQPESETSNTSHCCCWRSPGLAFRRSVLLWVLLLLVPRWELGGCVATALNHPRPRGSTLHSIPRPKVAFLVVDMEVPAFDMSGTCLRGLPCEGGLVQQTTIWAQWRRLMVGIIAAWQTLRQAACWAPAAAGKV